MANFSQNPNFPLPMVDSRFQQNLMFYSTGQFPFDPQNENQSTGLQMTNDNYYFPFSLLPTQQPFQASSQQSQSSCVPLIHFDHNNNTNSQYKQIYQSSQFNQQTSIDGQQKQQFQQQNQCQTYQPQPFQQQYQQELNRNINTDHSIQYISSQNRGTLQYPQQQQSNNLVYQGIPTDFFSSEQEPSQKFAQNPFQKPNQQNINQVGYQQDYGLQQQENNSMNQHCNGRSFLQGNENEIQNVNFNNQNYGEDHTNPSSGYQNNENGNDINNQNSNNNNNINNTPNTIGLEQASNFSEKGDQLIPKEISNPNITVKQSTPLALSYLPIKRGRGRPRKYPLMQGDPKIEILQNPGAIKLDETGNVIEGEGVIQDPAEAARIAALIKKQQEAEQRRKYKEMLKLKSQEMKSDESEYSECEEGDDDNINNNNIKKKKNDLVLLDDEEFNEKVIGKGNAEFLKHYKQRIIGRSSNSKIFELRDSITDNPIGEVIKEVPHKMSNLHQSECCELRNEFNFLSKMSHPRIISLGSTKEFIRDRNFCGIILPQARTNLMQFAKSQRHGKIQLSDVRTALKHVSQAVLYLHENYISHNDIKPDNIFVFGDDDYRLADFGFAMDLPKPNAFKRNSQFSQTLRKQVKIEDLKKNWKLRCKQYVAPELIKLLKGKRPRSASDEKACDVFALGVTVFIIVFYQLPFGGCALKTDQRYKHFFKGNHDKFWSQFHSMFAKFNQQENAHTSELRDLINKMLEPYPQKRITIQQILDHPWLHH